MDFVDLVGVEVLRVFAPDVYRAMVALKDELTGSSTGGSDQRARAATALHPLTEETDKLPGAQHIVRELFFCGMQDNLRRKHFAGV